jgi:hypothetical protein
MWKRNAMETLSGAKSIACSFLESELFIHYRRYSAFITPDTPQRAENE